MQDEPADRQPDRAPAASGAEDDEPASPRPAPTADAVLPARADVRADAEPQQRATEERYARPEADHLDDSLLAEIAARHTGATEAAFFDLDKTVIARSSTLVMSRTFLKDGLISPATVLKSLYAQAVYQLVGADHEKMEQMRHAALELTRGWEVERVRRLVRETMEEVLVPLAYQEALDVIAEHREAGRDVWIVSSSGEEIVEPFARYLGVDDYIATRSGIDENGCYDGTLAFYAYGTSKATAMHQIAEVRGYDLSRCYAYSDSITDLPMLSAVGRPTAVNPDRELRAAATAMGWRVRDFHAPVRLRDRLPDVRMPDVRMPDVHLPDMHMPDVRMPGMRLPDVPFPQVRLPAGGRPGNEVLVATATAVGLGVGLLAWRWLAPAPARGRR